MQKRKQIYSLENKVVILAKTQKFYTDAYSTFQLELIRYQVGESNTRQLVAFKRLPIAAQPLKQLSPPADCDLWS